VDRLLSQATKILAGTEANDSRTKARGRRAHARVLTMIALADATDHLRREQRIANLLALARVDEGAADWALAEARRMIAADPDHREIGPKDKTKQ
jgi:hypothetical protein